MDQSHLAGLAGTWLIPTCTIENGSGGGATGRDAAIYSSVTNNKNTAKDNEKLMPHRK